MEPRRSEPQQLESNLAPAIIGQVCIILWWFTYDQKAVDRHNAGCALRRDAGLAESSGNGDIIHLAMVLIVSKPLGLGRHNLDSFGKAQPQDRTLNLIGPSSPHVYQGPLHHWSKGRECYTRQSTTGAEVNTSCIVRHRQFRQNRRKAGAMRQLFFKIAANGAQAVGTLQRFHEVATEIGIHYSSSSPASAANRTM